MAKKLLIELPYLGNIAFYKLLTNFDEILIEKHEFFQKASYRNRCEISGPNGKLTLSIPIIGGKDKKQLYKETHISYEHPWLKDHWNSLCSAYRRSPYFEYYEDKFEAIYDKEYNNLFELNKAFFELIVSLLKIPNNISYTESYQKDLPDDIEDYRSYFLPKKEEKLAAVYWQVFQDRTGFIPNVSIIDLLFNEGPNSLEVLKKS